MCSSLAIASHELSLKLLLLHLEVRFPPEGLHFECGALGKQTFYMLYTVVESIHGLVSIVVLLIFSIERSACSH